jgi:hypothetical protein
MSPYFLAHPVMKRDVSVIIVCRVNVTLFSGASCYEEGRKRNYSMQGATSVQIGMCSNDCHRLFHFCKQTMNAPTHTHTHARTHAHCLANRLPKLRYTFCYVFYWINESAAWEWYSKSNPATRHEGAWEESRYSSYLFSTSALEGVWSGSRPGCALSPRKGPPVLIVQEAGWAPEPVCTQRLEEKSFLLCRGSNLDRPVF